MSLYKVLNLRAYHMFSHIACIFSQLLERVCNALHTVILDQIWVLWVSLQVHPKFDQTRFFPCVLPVSYPKVIFLCLLVPELYAHVVLCPMLALKADPMGDFMLPTSMGHWWTILQQPQLFYLQPFLRLLSQQVFNLNNLIKII